MPLPAVESRAPLAVAGWLLAAALFGWFLARLDLGAVADALADVDPIWVAAAALLQVAGLGARGVRWRSLLARRAPVPWRDAVEVTYMGWLLLALVPARLGELARPLLLARRHPVDRSYAFGALVLERVLDVAALLGLLAIYLRTAAGTARDPGASGVFGSLERFARSASWAALAGGVAIVAVTAAVPWLKRRGELVAVRARGGRIGWALARAQALAGGATTLRSPGAVAVALAQTALVWSLVLAAHGCLFLAFRLELARLDVVPVVVFVVLGAVVPVPAAIGAYHHAAQLALGSLLGVAPATAAAYALVAHAVGYLPNGAFGALLLAREGASWGELSFGRRRAP